SRCGPGVRRHHRGGIPAASLRAGDARSRTVDPDQRRTADLELSALAMRIFRVRVPGRALARLHAGSFRTVARGIRSSPAPLRHPGADLMGETVRRVLVAIPWIAVAIAIIVAGGPWFAGALVIFGCLGLREFFLMAEAYRPFQVPAYLALAG